MGAMAGAAKEYVKQSGEERKNKYQEIRDRRLAEMTTTENIRQETATTTENMRQEVVAGGAAETSASALLTQQNADRSSVETIEANKLAAKGPPTVGTAAGAESGHYEKQADGTFKYVKDVDQPKTFAETAGSSTTNKFLMEAVDLRGAGGKSVGKQTRGELQEEWYQKKYRPQLIDPQMPMMGSVLNEDKSIPGWVKYHNSMVTDEYKLAPNNPKYMQGDPDALWDYALKNYPAMKTEEGKAKAIERIKKANPRWEGPTGSKKPREPSTSMDTNPYQGSKPTPETPPVPVKQPATAGVMPGGGMLEQSNQGITTTQTMSETVNPGLTADLKKLEAELKSIANKTGHAAQTRKASLKKQIAKLKQLLD